MDTYVIDRNTYSAGAPPPMDLGTPFSSPHTDRVKVAIGGEATIARSEMAVARSVMAIPVRHREIVVPSEDVEQQIEDAIEDNDEEAWAAFLEIAPEFRTTDRWLAES